MRKKLLVMEDDKRVLEILALALGREGYQIIRTSGGLNGLRLAEKCGPDLIVIDLARTEPDSFTVCRIFHRFFTCCHKNHCKFMCETLGV